MLGLVRLNQNVAWYIARSSGLVAWVLVTASVLWGLIYAGRLTRKLPPPAWNLDVHRFLGGLSVSFVIIHVVALSADRYVNFGLRQILVPFASTWKPGPVAWGIVAMYLLVAVEVTSLAMRWLPRKLWRKVHLLTFVLFVMSTIHVWQSGTDIKNTAVRAVGLSATTGAIFTAVLRIIWAQRRQAARAGRAALPPPTAAPAAPGPAPAAPPPPAAPAVAVPEPVAVPGGVAAAGADESEWAPEPGLVAVAGLPRAVRPDRVRPPPLIAGARSGSVTARVPSAARAAPVGTARVATGRPRPSRVRPAAATEPDVAPAAASVRVRVPRDFFAPTRVRLPDPPDPPADDETGQLNRSPLSRHRSGAEPE